MNAMELLLRPLPKEKMPGAKMAAMLCIEAEDRLYIGDYPGAEGRFRSADAQWTVALLCLGYEGDHYSKRKDAR